MSDRGYVHSVLLTFGTGNQKGTQTFVSAPGTDTYAFLGPRDDMSFQMNLTVGISGTGTQTAIGGGTVVLQSSNDSVNWFGQGTAGNTATVSIASTGVVVATASATAVASGTFTGKWGYLRALVTCTGTGQTQAYVAF